MENTTITQFVNDNVEGDPAFKGYVVCELKVLVSENPTLSLSELLQDATEAALDIFHLIINIMVSVRITSLDESQGMFLLTRNKF